MGQSYSVIVIGEHDKAYMYDPWQVRCGRGLTDHAFITSPFVNVILNDILNNPKRIAWVGDYALEKSSRVPEKIKAKIKSVFDDIIPPDGDYENPYPYALRLNKIEYCHGLYLLNHDKKECVSLERYIEKNAKVRFFISTESADISFAEVNIRCMSPLALLTACGNGMGGGDYEGTDLREVGRWAFDRIELRKCSFESRLGTPEGYTLINPRFIENRFDS